jgi:hypothetical protein
MENMTNLTFDVLENRAKTIEKDMQQRVDTRNKLQVQLTALQQQLANANDDLKVMSGHLSETRYWQSLLSETAAPESASEAAN